MLEGEINMLENINGQIQNNLETYTAEEIMEILNIGKTAVYELIKDSYINKNNFKVLKIGKLYRIPKKSFDEWFAR